MRIAYRAEADVKAAIDRAGRTEDVQFSPDGSRLALACLTENRLLLLGVRIHRSGTTPEITLSGFTEVESPSLHFPHGLSWADDHTLVVGNRYGEVTILPLPADHSASHLRAQSVRNIGADTGQLVKTPGSLSVVPIGLGLFELLVCNNYVHHISRHLLDQRSGWTVLSSEILLRDGLDVPDGVTHSTFGDWIAISNHGEHSVFLYRNEPRLHAGSKPHGVLRGLCYPHGLSFAPDGSNLLVADAGTPFVHLFTSRDGDWHGDRYPDASFRIVDDKDFLRGNHSPEEGGPKGLDVSPDGRIMVTSCEEVPLALFDLEGTMARSGARTTAVGVRSDDERLRDSLVRYVSSRGNQVQEATEAIRRASEWEVANVLNSRSWRMTAPLRWINARRTQLALRNRRRRREN